MAQVTVVLPEHILQLLPNTWSADAQERKVAEQHLTQLEKVQGYCASLLKIVSTNEIHESVRLSASILLKRFIQHCWFDWKKNEDNNDNASSGVGRLQWTDYVVPESDKSFMLSNIIEGIIHSDAKVKLQLADALKTMADNEYPDPWGNTLIPQLQTFLQSKDLKVLSGTILSIRTIIKKYEYIPASPRRKPLFPLVDSLFPQLTKIFEELNKHLTTESAEMQLLLVKTFWSTVNMGVPPFLQNNNNLFPWMTCMMNLLQMQLPQDGNLLCLWSNFQGKTPEVWWKLKKWVSQNFSRLFIRYCNLKDAPSAEGKLFAKNFNAIYAPKLLEAFVTLLGQKKGENYLSDRVVHSAIGFLDSALRNANMYRILKPHLDSMFREIIFPVICFNAQDQELWNEDPQEYLRKEFDIMEEFYHPRSAALAFTCNLVRLRGKTHFAPLMAFTAQVLYKYASAAPQDRNPSEKDGALQTIGNLPEKILSSKEMEAQVEAMLISHVIPEFTSPYGFLRARCCWLMAQFYELDWKNQQAFLAALRCVIICLKDKELPVRVRAALSLRHLIQNDIGREEIRQILPQLLDAFFSLMNEIDNDELVNTLDLIIERYRDEMEPYAVLLCKKLSEMIMRILSETENDNDNDNEEDSAITVFESLSAIHTILDAVSDKPHLYVEIEKILYPVMVKLCNPDASDFFEEGMKLISFITCFAPTITPEMWYFFKRLYDIFDKSGIEYVSELLIPYDNYINRGTQHFLQNNYITFVFDIIKRVLTNEIALETQCGDACKLIEIVLHNLRGHVDNLIGPFLQLAINKFNSAKTNSLKVLLLDVVMNSAYYNPGLFLNILESKGWTQATFNVWFQMIPTLPRILDKKICILGLSAILTLPFDSLPALVKQGYLQLIKAAIQINKDLYKQREEQEKEEDESDEDDILGAKIEDAEIDENEEALEEEQQLQQLTAEVQKAYQDYEQEDDFLGADLDDYDELEDEDDYTTPIDDIDELVLFTDAMKAIATNPVLYQSIMGQLEPQAQVDLKDIFEWTEKRKVQLANQNKTFK